MVQLPPDQKLPDKDVKGMFEGLDVGGNGDHELSNGMKVKSGASGLQFARFTNQFIDLAQEQLQQTYHEVSNQWHALYDQTGLQQIIRDLVNEHLEREDPPSFSHCYFLTPKWQPAPIAIARVAPEKPWEKDRRQAKPEERKALFSLAVFISIVETIEEVQSTFCNRFIHHSQFKKNFLEVHYLQEDDHWDWHALEPEASLVFNGGIDPDQLAIVLDLEPALLFTEQLPTLSKDNPGGLGNNFEAFEAMKKKFLPKYKPHDVAATEQEPEHDPNEIEQISKSIGIKASTLFSKQGHGPEQGDHHQPEHGDLPIWAMESGRQEYDMNHRAEERGHILKALPEQRSAHVPVEVDWFPHVEEHQEEEQHDQHEEEEQHDQHEEEEHDQQEEDSDWPPYLGHDAVPHYAAMIAGGMENGTWEGPEGDGGEHHDEDGEEDPNEWQQE